jgi:hypothetical protein
MQLKSLIFFAYLLTPFAFATDAKTETILNQADRDCKTAQTASMFKALKLAKSCIKTYETVYEQDSSNRRALVSAIYYHLQAPGVAGGSEDKAKRYLQDLAKYNLEQSEVIWLEHLLAHDRQKEAIQIANQLETGKIKYLATHYFLARTYRGEKQYDKSLAHLETLQTKAATINRTKQDDWYLTDSNLQIGETYLLLKKDPQLAIDKLLIYQNEMKDPRDKHYFWGLWSLAKAYKAANKMQEYQQLVKQIKKQDYKKDKKFKREFEAGIKR